MGTIPSETVTVTSEGQTVRKILWRKFRRPMTGLVEATLDANQGLAAVSPDLPVGTTFTIPEVTDSETTLAADVVSLWD